MFRYSDKHAEEFKRDGFTVFKGAIPPALIDDLRVVCDKAREIARADGGPSVQRLQPVKDFDLDQRPFKDYGELPEVRAGLEKLLSPKHYYGTKHLGVLFEPAQQPWVTRWHRDWRDNALPKEYWPRWESAIHDLDLFNQINAALFEDSSLWVVPGSHARLDTPEEAQRFPTRPIHAPTLDGFSDAMRERIGLDYCRSMPNAFQVLLDAGDIAIYRNTLWHIGNYVPYRKRATLHDGAMTAEYEAWWAESRRMIQEWEARTGHPVG